MATIKKRKVVDHIVETLYEYGVRHVFGIPGDAINDLMDAIRRHGNIEFIQVRHEESGAFAASTQAKLTGKLAVCVGTAGGGAIHLLNGLYDAKLDHAPVLAITGQLPRCEIGNDSHQEINSSALFSDVTVFNQTLFASDRVPEIIQQACNSALIEKGVAHISLPVDVATEQVESGITCHPIAGTKTGDTKPLASALNNVLRLIQQAEKIVVLAGVGAIPARQQLLTLLKKCNAPLIRTLKAKVLLPDEHEYSLGGLGLLGTRPSVDAINNCDLLVMLGTDFPYKEYYPGKAKVIQVDKDVRHIGRRCPVDLSIVGDVSEVLDQLLADLSQKDNDNFLTECRHQKMKWSREQSEKESSQDTPIKPQYLARSVGELANKDAIFLCDTGTVTAWVARHLPVTEHQLFTLSGNLATMAFSMAGAIGAQLKYPDRQVIALIGDGGFSMLMQEFITVVNRKLPIKIIIFNNAKLGLIQLEQESSGYPEYKTALENPDFSEFARLCGGEGWSVDRPELLVDALKEAFTSTNACVIDVHVDPNELVMPPKLELSQAVNYSIAKTKEFINSND
ncbi:MAG: thiamine pyrophosphate-dependent acetolactate synthase large subunit-like protein [Glaciecola sp.]|jgi:thiamine pyrophosphate-dependent acetolactate synthase large subunit-like protein